jgi:subtilase family serine protease
MAVHVAVTMQNPTGLVTYARSVSNPTSASYRHFLTPQQIGQTYGATTGNYQKVAQYFRNEGLHVGGWPQHLSLLVSGTQPELEAAFHTTFGVYQGTDGTQFISPSSTPSFGTSILPVTAVTNIVSRVRMTRAFVPVRASNASTDGYSPAQIRNVFDYLGAYNAGYTGAGITIGIIGTGPISAADVPTFAGTFNVPAASVTQVDATDEGVAAGLALNSPAPNPSASPPYQFPYNAGLSSPPPVTASCNGLLPSCNPEDVEAQIDTEQAATLAPGSSVLFYLAYNAGACAAPGPAVQPNDPCPANMFGQSNAEPALGLALDDDEIQQAIADNKADILSLSYGGSELSDPSTGQYGAAGVYFDPSNPSAGFGPTEFAALAAEGIAVFVASGDLGAETCKRGPDIDLDDLCLSYPASDPSVVAVGGVTTPMNQFGVLTNQITAWGLQTTGGIAGSGGGVSAYFPMPAYQQVPGAEGTMRNVPDVSLEADANTGVAVLLNATLGGPTIVQEGGTSVAAPEMAAMWALVLQACRQSATCAHGSGPYPYRLGDPAALLYAQYYANGALQPQYATTFDDVLYGNNALLEGASPVVGGPLDAGYNAGVGYDLVTGLGVPFADHLISTVLAAEGS